MRTGSTARRWGNGLLKCGDPSEFDSEEPGQPQGSKAALGVREGSPLQELEGVSLAWEESGEGVPVVCLHAAGHGASDFRPLQQQSPADCRLLLFDWPGHGRSSEDGQAFTVEHGVELLSRFLNALGLHDAVLLGAEFGATVALTFALQHPQRVRGLILCHPAGMVEPENRRRSLGLGATAKRLVRALFARPIGDLSELQEKLIHALRASHDAQLRQAAQSVAALQDFLREGLARVSCPVLIALGAASRPYPLKAFQQLLAPLLGARAQDRPNPVKLAIFAGRGSPLWESPARLARILSGFAAATLPLEKHRHAWIPAATDWPTRGMTTWKCTHAACHAELALPIGQNPNVPGAGVESPR